MPNSIFKNLSSVVNVSVYKEEKINEYEKYARKIAEGNSDVLSLLMFLFKFYTNCVLLRYLDNYSIRGEKIWYLYDKCCKKNINEFVHTIDMIGCGCFSQKDIDDNLNYENGFYIPFIDNASYIYYITNGYGFGPENGKFWKNFCRENTDAFIQKIEIYRKQKDEEINNQKILERKTNNI